MDNKLTTSIDSMVVSNNLEHLAHMDNGLADSALLVEHVHQVCPSSEQLALCRTCMNFRLRFEFAEIAETGAVVTCIALKPFQMQSMFSSSRHGRLLSQFASVLGNTPRLLSSAERHSHFHSTESATLGRRFHSSRGLLRHMTKRDNQRQLVSLFQRKDFKQ